MMNESSTTPDAAKSASSSQVTTLIFDVDDTLYDVGSGFTAYRNGVGAQTFMVSHLGFPDLESARVVRDEYFEKYHSTAKALTIAQAEGRLPPQAPVFRAEDLSAWWATKLPFDLLGGPNLELERDLMECPLKLVAFSNAPRQYAKRVLAELNLLHLFGEDRLFAVEDVLPFCKPEREAFDKLLNTIGVKAEECVLIEDSMKNIRKAKEIGMKTVLVVGKDRLRTEGNNETSANNDAAAASEATKPGDAPDGDDPSVDVCIESVNEIRSVLPGLWRKPAIFDPLNK